MRKYGSTRNWERKLSSINIIMILHKIKVMLINEIEKRKQYILLKFLISSSTVIFMLNISFIYQIEDIIYDKKWVSFFFFGNNMANARLCSEAKGIESNDPGKSILSSYYSFKNCHFLISNGSCCCYCCFSFHSYREHFTNHFFSRKAS